MTRSLSLPLLLLLLAPGCDSGTDEGDKHAVDVDGDGAAADKDCDDEDAAIFPHADEVCDDIDNDCDGDVDEDATDGRAWYTDDDGDGSGAGDPSQLKCERPEGKVENAEDCDDADATAYPGALEACGGGDEDCDGEIDESGAQGEASWYPDEDLDGHGAGTATLGCEGPAGSASASDDCNDADANAWRGATEVCDGSDNDCDPATLEENTVAFYPGDGTVVDVTADFAGGTRSTPLPVTLTEGQYDFCDGTWYVALTVSGTTTLQGVGAGGETILDGGGENTIIEVTGRNPAIVVSNLFLENGNASVTSPDPLLNDYTFGGALSCLSVGSVTLDGVIASGNTAGVGGAVGLISCNLTVRSSIFEGNDATFGGAVYVLSADVTVEESTFKNNSAERTAGALGAEGDGVALATTTVRDSQFLANTATYGGALAVQVGMGLSCEATDVGRSALLSNVATYGGGMYLSDESSGSTLASDGCDFGVLDEGTDNSVDDVYVYDNQSSYTYDDDASFTCDGDGCR